MDKVPDLLTKAKELHSQRNLHVAINTLYEAAAIITLEKEKAPKLGRTAEEQGGSEKNATSDSGQQEIIYYSKLGNIHYDLGNFKNDQAEFEAALENYIKIQEKLPNIPKVYKAVGDALRKLHRIEEAIQEYDKGIKIIEEDDSADDSDKAAILNCKALLLIEVRRYEDAVKALSEAVSVEPNNALYHCNLGKAYYGLGKTTEGIGCYKKAKDALSNSQGSLSTDNIEYIKANLDKFLGLLGKLEVISKIRKGQNFERKIQSIINHNDAKIMDDARNTTDSTKDQDQIIQDVIQSVKDAEELHEQSQLAFEFYDAFVYALSGSYATSIQVEKGAFIVPTGKSSVSIFTKAVSLIPIYGTQIADTIDSIAKFIENADNKKKASNCVKFASNQSNADKIFEAAALKFVKSIARDLEKPGTKDLISQRLSSWSGTFFGKLGKFIEKIKETKEKLEAQIYGERNETPHQKFGHKIATEIIEKYLVTGDIYGGQLASSLKEKDKIEALNVATAKILNENLIKITEAAAKSVENKYKAEPSSSEAQSSTAAGSNKKKGGCCNIF